MKRLLIAVAALGLAVPASAAAHANLVRLQPANGAVVAKAPSEVKVVFDDIVRVGPGVQAIRNHAGSILGGPARVEGSRTLVIPLRHGLQNGDYSVRWSIVSDDGHLESGVLAFAVGLGRPAPTATLVAESTRPSGTAVVSRWLFYAGLLVAVGIGLLSLVARPRDGERLAVGLSAAAALAAVGAAEEAHRVGLHSRAGTTLGSGFVLAVVVATVAGAATLERRLLRPAVILALGLAVVPPFAGHAFDRGLNRLNVPADVLHLLGASAWVGALLGLVVFRDGSTRRTIMLALAGVLLLGATGILRTSFELLRVSQLWTTSYGQVLLVKSGLLLLALAGGWLLRGKVRRRAGFELFVIAGVLVAVSILVLLRPGRNVVIAPLAQADSSQPSPPPPPPPRGAVVLAQELGPLGVAIATEPRRITATVLSPAGGGLSGLEVKIAGQAATSCGHGCYSVGVVPGRTVRVEVGGFGTTQQISFDVPASPRNGSALLRRAQGSYSTLQSVAYLERLAYDQDHSITTLWRLERRDRVSYSIAGGAEGIVIGSRRWDRANRSSPWKESAQTPLTQPATPWNEATNVHLIADNGVTKTVTFADPTVPAYFMVVLDAKTLLPRTLQMVAAAHFMTDRYTSFNELRKIFPPPK